MTAGTVEFARGRLERAQAALDQALGEGNDTSRLRDLRDRAREDVERLASAQAQSAAQAEAERAQRLTKIAESETRELAEALARELAAYVHVAVPDLHLPAGLRVAVHEARETVQAAEGAAAAAQARVAGLEARLTELSRRRGEIVSRRASGDVRPSDGADLALLDADRDGLTDLRESERSITIAPTQRLSDARARLAHAEAQWAAAVAAARAAALLDVCRGLETALVRAASMAYELRGGSTSYWRPGEALRSVMAYGRPPRAAA